MLSRLLKAFLWDSLWKWLQSRERSDIALLKATGLVPTLRLRQEVYRFG
jgi:hypothetical protein